MTDRTKKCLAAAIFCVAAGIACIGIGFFAGAAKHMELWSLQVGKHNVGVYGLEQHTLDETYTEPIRGLDFQIGASEAVIRSGDCFSISGTVPKEVTSCVTADGVWKIGEGSGSIGVDIGVWDQEEANRITITIPSDAVFERVRIEMGAGTLTAKQIRTEELSVSIGAGEGTVQNMNVGSLDAECGAGELTLSGSIREGAQIDCGMGSVTVSLSGREDAFDYDLDCGMGEIRIGDEYAAGVAAERRIDHSAGKKISVECGMGEVAICFAE